MHSSILGWKWWSYWWYVFQSKCRCNRIFLSKSNGRKWSQGICMAKVQWFEHPIESTTLQGQLQFWCATLTKPFGPASFLPVTRIKQVCISCELNIGTDTIIAVDCVSLIPCMMTHDNHVVGLFNWYSAQTLTLNNNILFQWTTLYCTLSLINACVIHIHLIFASYSYRIWVHRPVARKFLREVLFERNVDLC